MHPFHIFSIVGVAVGAIFLLLGLFNSNIASEAWAGYALIVIGVILFLLTIPEPETKTEEP